MGKIAVVGGSSLFHDFLKLSGADVEFVSSAGKAVNNLSFDGLILLPDYESGKESVPQFCIDDVEVIAARKRNGFRIYAENYLSYNTYNKSVFGFEVTGNVCHITSESLCAYNEFQHILGTGRILQAAGAAYLPALCKITDPYVLEKGILLKKGQFIGTSQISPLPVNNSSDILVRSGSVYSSLISITNLDTVNFRPNSRWKCVYAEIFSYILGVDKENIISAFEQCYPPLKTTMSPDTVIEKTDLKNVCRNALDKAVKWHFDSGIILSEDEKKGSVEMIMSSNGQKLYENRRVDAGFYTGWLVCATGKYFNNSKWYDTGKNIFDYFAERTQIKGGTYDGLFTWYYNENAAPHDIYSIDCGRDGIALCNMYQITGDKKILEKIKGLAEGFSNWTNNDLLYSVCVQHPDDPATWPHSDSSHLMPWAKSVRTPGIYGEMISFMVMASKLLNEEKYLDIAIRITDRLAKDYPDYEYHGHTTSARNAHFLLALLCIQHTGKRDYSHLINILIDYLQSIQLPCGGIYCEDNITFEKNLKNSANTAAFEYENGIVTPWENDKISDQLYVVNNALAALSVLKALPDNTGVNKDKGLEIFKGLIEYVTKIQIKSDDKRFNGGWMRAFSITHQEYYGLDLDKFWGAYCIMAGWTMGIIPLALLSELTDDCPYVITDTY